MRRTDPREAAAERALRDLGIRARVVARGPDGDIAALLVDTADWPRLTGAEAPAFAARVREVGFSYVSLELAPDPAPAPQIDRPSDGHGEQR